MTSLVGRAGISDEDETMATETPPRPEELPEAPLPASRVLRRWGWVAALVVALALVAIAVAMTWPSDGVSCDCRGGADEASQECRVASAARGSIACVSHRDGGLSLRVR